MVMKHKVKAIIKSYIQIWVKVLRLHTFVLFFVWNRESVNKSRNICAAVQCSVYHLVINLFFFFYLSIIHLLFYSDEDKFFASIKYLKNKTQLFIFKTPQKDWHNDSLWIFVHMIVLILACVLFTSAQIRAVNIVSNALQCWAIV